MLGVSLLLVLRGGPDDAQAFVRSRGQGVGACLGGAGRPAGTGAHSDQPDLLSTPSRRPPTPPSTSLPELCLSWAAWPVGMLVGEAPSPSKELAAGRGPSGALGWGFAGGGRQPSVRGQLLTAPHVALEMEPQYPSKSRLRLQRARSPCPPRTLGPVPGLAAAGLDNLFLFLGGGAIVI